MDLHGQHTLAAAIDQDIKELSEQLCAKLSKLSQEETVNALNFVRRSLHEISPFRSEPVDLVQWVKNTCVHANDYNPNSVAPPEMELLKVSIDADGYTQPIVAMADPDGYEVIDGFHRHRVGKEFAAIKTRVHGYLPVVQIRSSQSDKSDRMASTIRHNRARGKHKVEAMSDIVIELKRRNWSYEKIAKNLGMDADEVLRLCQITGLADAFKDQNFSTAWEVGDEHGAGEEILSDVITDFVPNDKGRIFHTFDRWECYKAGFYAERPPSGMTQDEGEEVYREFLSDLTAFGAALHAVTTQWVNSCEHYLTNERMNRIAWLGQASVAYSKGIPSICRGGYQRLTAEQQAAADALALEYLNKWLTARGMAAVDYEAAGGRTEAELY
jgi:ParB-like chromosome segregation protein Spo0J